MTRRGRPPTGSLVRDEQGRPIGARVTLAGNVRRVIPFKDGPLSEERAKELARALAKRVRELGYIPEETGETVNEWEERWVKAREVKGLTSTGQDHGRYRKWIAPVLGHMPMKAVTRRDLEVVVERLDRAVRESKGAFKWKTAVNCWGVASKMFSDACRSKVLDLRVRDDNPAREVQGPDRGIERSGPYLFPAEFNAIMACSRVPSRWKRLIAVAVYTYTRRGELAALECSDVNLTRGYIHVHRAMNELGEIKATKTKDTRKVPIEPALLPLLEAMHEAARGEGPVMTAMPPREETAKRLRRYVEWACEDAGIQVREELLADDETRRPLSWHDLRHSGITWRAVRGDEPLKIQRASGHSDLRTTQRYINEAQTFEDEGTFGEPFPPLPLGSLLQPSGSGGGGNIGTTFGFLPRAAARSPRKQGVVGRPQGDSKTRVANLEGPRKAAKDVESSSSPEDIRGFSASRVPELFESADAPLMRALEAATVAGRFDVVAQLARELEARRLAREPNVVSIGKPRRSG